MSLFLSRVRGAIASWFSPRFDPTTGRRRRRPAPLIAAGTALALLLGSGVAVAATAGAEAHVPTVEVSCSNLHVNLQWYPAGAHVTIVVGGVTQVDGDFVAADFEPPGFTRDFPIPADTATSWSVLVDAPDGDNGTQFDYSNSGTTTPCVGPRVPSLTATTCDAPGGLVDLAATFEGLDQSHTYTVELSSAGGTNIAPAPFVATAATGSTSFTGVTPGYSYTVTLVDTTAGLSGSATVMAVGCPQDPDLTISATECTVAGGSGQFTATIGSLVAGRQYTISLLTSAGANVASETVTADSTGTVTRTVSVPPSGSYYATVTDVGSGVSRTSATLSYLPCPDKPTTPALEVTNCTAVPGDGDKTAGATLSLSVSGLVPGRRYDITVTNAAGTAVLQVLGLVATSSTYTDTVSGLATGSYSATATDVLVPSYASTASTSVLPCPTYDTTIDLSATACTELGQSLDLTATVSDYAVGRPYTVTLLRNGSAVGAAKTLDSSTGAPQSLVFSGLIPGATYAVRVTDDLSTPVVTVVEVITLGTCPGQPALEIAAGPCKVIGFSDVIASATSLEVGDEYRVSLAQTLSGDPVTGVPDVTFTATADAQKVTLKNVPNGASYTATIEAIGSGLTASANTRLGICDPPTLPEPPTLAFTGSPIGATVLTALALLQLGLALFGFTLVRRRPRRRA